jgi:hypothetical protein
MAAIYESQIPFMVEGEYRRLQRRAFSNMRAFDKKYSSTRELPETEMTRITNIYLRTTSPHVGAGTTTAHNDGIFIFSLRGPPSSSLLAEDVG